MIISPILIRTFDDTNWDSINSMLRYFGILTYFTEGTNQLAVFCYIIFAVITIFSSLFVYKLIHWDEEFHPVIGWFVSFGFNTSCMIILQPLTCCSLYFFARFIDGTYAEYKGISDNLVELKSTSHIILTSIMSLCLLIVIVISIIVALLYQNKTFSLWCGYEWHINLATLLLKIIISINLVLDKNDDYGFIFNMIIIALCLILIVLRFFNSLYWEFLFDLFELGFDSCMLFLECLLFVNYIFTSFSVSDNYHYSAFAIIYAFLICVVKYNMKENKIEAVVANEDEAISHMRTILTFCLAGNSANFKSILGILILHKDNCTKPNCPCEELCSEAMKKADENIKIELNNKAYETKKKQKEQFFGSWKHRVIEFISSELNSQLGKATQFLLFLAEIDFYCNGNIYRAILHLKTIETLKHSIMFNQYTINLRQTIEKGMWSEEKETIKFMEVLNFQRKYDKFLDYLEEAVEAVATFWTTVGSEKMETKAFVRHGKNLYELNYNLMKLAKEVNEINPHHLDFLVKYGLYMKLIAHNRFAVNQVFNKILWIAEDFDLCKGPLRAFSSIKNECQTMIVTISLEQGDFFQIIEANSEVEYQLGYKKEELLRFSANKLIPQEIAKRHHQVINKFFKTMESKCIGNWKLKFLKHRDEYIVPCMMLVHIIPTIKNGLQALSIFHVDEKMSIYAKEKTDNTKNKVKVFIIIDWCYYI